jgi:uracil-DNA glycosylase family 4
MDERLTRKLRQHVRTDALLGVESVPMGTGPLRTASPVQPAAPAPAAPVAPPVHTPARPRAGNKLQVLDAIDRDEVRNCQKCVLCQSRTNTVFGEGDPNARVMFIGEGPGQTEDELGRPFVGRAGELLDKQIAAMGLSREQVYIANIVKCRPPQNRTPAPDEVQACFDYLVRQIEIVQPEVIVTLGGPAIKALIDTKEGVTRIRGTWFEFTALALRGGPTIPVMPTFHPAYLLRSYTVDNRKKVWSDLQQVMQRLGLTATKG